MQAYHKLNVMTREQELVGFHLHLRERLAIQALLANPDPPLSHHEHQFAAQVRGKMMDPMPFLSVKQAQWLDQLLARQGALGLDQLCDAMPQLTWRNSSSSLVERSLKWAQLLRGDCQWHREYDARFASQWILEVRCQDEMIILGFSLECDQQFVEQEIVHQDNDPMMTLDDCW